MLPKDIFPENFIKIDSEMTEIFEDQTMTKNNNNSEENTVEYNTVGNGRP